MPCSPPENHAPDSARIMVVEDVDFNLEIIRLILEEQGWQVSGAVSAEEALTILAADRDFQMIIMDLGLPGMDGFAAARLLKKDPFTSAIPVLALSAESPAEPETLREAGFAGFLEKTFDPDRMVAEINKFLSPAEAKQGKPSPPGAAAKENSHLDFAALRAAYPEEGAVRRMAAAFFSDAHQELTRLAEAVGKENLPALRAACHGLMGAAAIFKADKLRLAAQTLAACARDGNKAELPLAWADLLAAHLALREAVLNELDLATPSFPPEQ